MPVFETNMTARKDEVVGSNPNDDAKTSYIKNLKLHAKLLVVF